ncbi:MAG: response regulator [Gemmataceae bacterium]|nr:response regulator [Gemmataceae bacterium]
MNMDIRRQQPTRTVLVIDDDAGVRETLRMALEDWGFRVICAPDGEIGISRAVKDDPDLIICDMMMPKASGFVVLDRLKNQFGSKIPFIMLTGNESEHQRAFAEVLGVDHYLHKPVRPLQLQETIGKCLPFAPVSPVP